ncbi:hypothetical protein BDR26DRAFT_557792 [Obelidium mucronatum]|nr:hypothetical protein BDR26DRAFT_557792 [Obelidium mucronatum]
MSVLWNHWRLKVGENDTWGSVFSKGVIGKGWMGSGVQKGGVGKVRSCIRIGILKDSYDDSKLETLVDIVLKKGRELERGDQFLATLSDVIKRGIHNAEINLKKQSHDDEVSMFRSLPVIGTVLGFMGVLPSASRSSEAIVSEEPEQTVAGDDSDVASLIEAKVYGAVSSEDMSGPRRPASNLGAHHPRAVARSFTLSSGFSTVPIEEERIVKVSPPALASVSQVESFVTDRTETDVDGEGEGEEILMEDLEGDRGDNEVEDENEYAGKLELEEQEGGYVGNGELVVGMIDDEGYTAENEEEEEFAEDEEDV